jgi:hypothetical protein
MIESRSVALAWLPHHGGQDHESTDIDTYRDDDQYHQRDPGDHRDSLKLTRPKRVGRVRPVHIGWNTRRES